MHSVGKLTKRLIFNIASEASYVTLQSKNSLNLPNSLIHIIRQIHQIHKKSNSLR